MERGYVKYWRSIDDNELLDNDNTCYVIFGKLLTRVDRLTGTYTTGRNKLASICNMKPPTLYSGLKRLEASSIIQLQSSKTSTTIYICNWHKYQQDSINRASERQSTVITKQEKEKEKEYIDTSSSTELDRFHSWICELFGKNPNRFKLTQKRRQHLKLRLKPSELGGDRLKQAYEAISVSPWHRGDNDRGWKIDDDPYWLISSAEKAEKWANKYDEMHKYTGKLSEMEIK